MAEVGRVSPTDLQLIRKEIEVQGELLNQESLDRKAEVNHLRLELDALKRLLETMFPGFLENYKEMYEQERLTWNPETESREPGAIQKPVERPITFRPRGYRREA